MPRDMNPKGGTRVVVAVTAMITIGGTGIMGETAVGEEGGEEDEVVITEVGTIDRRTGIGIRMIGNRYPPDDICDADEADRGALHREGLGVVVLHEGTTEPGVLLVATHADPRLRHNRLRSSLWNQARTSLGEISDPVRLTPKKLQLNQYSRFQQRF